MAVAKVLSGIQLSAALSDQSNNEKVLQELDRYIGFIPARAQHPINTESSIELYNLLMLPRETEAYLPRSKRAMQSIIRVYEIRNSRAQTVNMKRLGSCRQIVSSVNEPERQRILKEWLETEEKSKRKDHTKSRWRVNTLCPVGLVNKGNSKCEGKGRYIKKIFYLVQPVISMHFYNVSSQLIRCDLVC